MNELLNKPPQKGRRRRHNAKDSGGFTIMEVLISMLLFTLMMVGIAAMQVTVLRGSATSRQMTMATQLAQSRIEEFRMMPFGSIVVTTPVDDAWFDYSGVSLGSALPTTFYTRRLTIVNPGGSVCSQVTTGRGIQVDVNWTDTAGTQSVTFCLERTTR